MKVYHTVQKPFLIRKWMEWNKFDALTTPWGTIYYKDNKSFMDGKLRRHELKHIEQMEREGVLKFLVNYNYYWILYGYWNNPYEIEAREAETL